jgi:ser/thr/tyr protein kinase RAD53
LVAAQHFIRRLLDANPATRMTLTDALRHPWLDPSAPPIASTSTTTNNAMTPAGTAASQGAVDRNFSELSELSELEMDDDDLAAQAGADVSMLSAIPFMDDNNMPGVDSLNITSPPARPRTRPRAPLERRSQVIARELVAEEEAEGSPTNTNTNTNDNGKKQSGGKRARPGSAGRGSPDDVAMAEGGGESDGEEEHGERRRRHAAKRGRIGEGSESKSPSPPSGTGNGNGIGRSLRSRNGPGAAGTPRR